MLKDIFKICCLVALVGHFFTSQSLAQPAASGAMNEDEVILLLANRCDRSVVYINEIVEAAKLLKRQERIPVQVTLGILLIESNGTQSELADKTGNLFGLTCSFDWEGPSYQMPHDQYDAETGKLVTVWTCFRSYTGGPSASVRDFGEFVTHQKRWWFSPAWNCPAFDADCWLDGLRRYATDPNWADNVRNAIQKYQLKVLDK
jgi:flagellum-specific peptidoglycan hydrolase FlgJ